jgi:hypothetical protein
LGVSLGSRGVVCLGVEGGRTVDHSKDLTTAGEIRRAEMVRHVPKIGANKRLRALGIGLFDANPNAELRNLALNRWLCQEFGIVDQNGLAVDPERLADTGDDEQNPDVRVANDIAERVGDLVAGTLRKQQRSIIEDADEPRRVATRTDPAFATRRGRGQADKRRTFDVRAGRSPVLNLDD